MNASRSPDTRKSKRQKMDPSDDESSEEGPQLPPPAAESNESSAVNHSRRNSTAESDTEDHCVICLQMIVDRTVLPACAHDRFCFECLEMWASQSRKCPLCTAAIGTYIIHNIRSQYDFSRYHLPPLRTSPPPVLSLSQASSRRRRQAPQIRWGRTGSRNIQEQDDFDRAVERRKWVYRHRLYAKHIASNQYTRFKPYPTPQQFAASQDLVSRTTAFTRRELQVWTNLDVEFLTSFILALMKSIDIRAESAVKLLSEFLDMDATESGRRPNAEHFAHELYTYLRSPYRYLTVYDSVIQYDQAENVPSPPTQRQRHDRWASQPRPPRSPTRRSRSREHDRRHEVNHRTRRDTRGQSDDDDILERSPRDLYSPRDHPPSPAPRRRYSRSRRGHNYRPRNRNRSRDWSGDGGRTVRYYPSARTTRRQRDRSRNSSRNRSPELSDRMRSSSSSPLLRRSRSRSRSRTLDSDPDGFDRRSESRDRSREASPSHGRSRRLSPTSSSPMNSLVRSPSVASSSRRRSDRSQSAAYKVEEDDQIPDTDPTIKESGGTVIGLSIKGQAAKLGLIKTRLADDDEMVDASDRVQALHSITLPRLLARMTDSKRTSEKASGAEEVAPSVADIMARTRHQLSLKRKGKGKAVDSDAAADDDLDLSYPDSGVPHNDASYLDAERRKQLMAKLTEERKKFVQPEASPQTELTPKLRNPSNPDESSKYSSLDAHESRLRAQARLRVKLAAEKRKVSGGVPLPSPSTSTPISTGLTPTEVPPTPILPSPTTGPLLSLEDGLKAKLKQRQAVASKEQDLKERLMERKQSLL